MSVDHRLLDMIACPQCKGSLYPCEQRKSLCCPHCKLKFPVRDDIPIILLDEAEPYEGQQP